MGQADRALTEFNAVLKADPKNIAAIGNIGFALLQRGDIAKAIDQYQPRCGLSRIPRRCTTISDWHTNSETNSNPPKFIYVALSNSIAISSKHTILLGSLAGRQASSRRRKNRCVRRHRRSPTMPRPGRCWEPCRSSRTRQRKR